MVSVLSMSSTELPTAVMPEEEGEILEDGELEDAEVAELVEEDEADEDHLNAIEIITTEEKKKKRKHQKKHKRHKEDRSEEKKSKRKRKKHGLEDDGENSPQGKKRRKRKKRSLEKRDTSTSESDLSSEYSRRSASMQRYQDNVSAHDGYEYYGYSGQTQNYESFGMDKEQNNTYKQKSYNNSNNMSSSNYNDGEAYEYEENEEEQYQDDFESQLADYQKYKTTGNENKHYSNRQGKNEETYSDNDNEYYHNNHSASRNINNKNQRQNNRNNTKSHNQKEYNRRHEKNINRQRSSRWESTESSNHSNNKSNKNYNSQYDNGDIDDEDTSHAVCKFNVGGSCAKGQDCQFLHPVSQNSSSHHQHKHKKRELCKYYLAGHCHHGNDCTYMHEEYPCKYFHTGAQCYAADGCRFSHDPANEETKDIIEKLQEVFNDVDDSWEIEELKKEGITPHMKPPPGQGLLPTPKLEIPIQFQAMMAAAAAAGQLPLLPPPQLFIPSIFDINVQPTPDFQQRIDNKKPQRAIREIEAADMLLALSEVPSLNMGVDFDMTSPTRGQSDQAHSQSDNTIENCSRTPPWLQNQNANSDTYSKFYSKKDHNTSDKENNENTKRGKDNTGQLPNDEQVKAPDFLPAKQKELFMRIHHKRTSQESKENAPPNNDSRSQHDNWTYSSDEENISSNTIQDCDVIKMDSDEIPRNPTSQSSVQSIVNMITNKTDSSMSVDKSLLSKVASVIDMSNQTATSDGNLHYNPATGTNYSSQTKSSPKHSTHSHHRERKSSTSSNGSTSSHRIHHHHPLRRRVSTQELNKEPVVIPLVMKETTNSIHSSHPDPRMSLSRLLGAKKSLFTSTIPPFSKEILMSSGKLVGLKITLSAEGKTSSSANTKRSDPRLTHRQRSDPRMSKASDPRLRRKQNTNNTNTDNNETDKKEIKSIIPPTPPALITKTSVPIPSLPELNLDLANIKNKKSTSNDTNDIKNAFLHLTLPKLTKAPSEHKTVEKEVAKSILSNTDPDNEEKPQATIAPYDPRYMSANIKPMPTAPYDPRTQSSTMYDSQTNSDIKKRTIQLPKLTLAPTFQNENDEIPEGDQADF